MFCSIVHYFLGFNRIIFRSVSRKILDPSAKSFFSYAIFFGHSQRTSFSGTIPTFTLCRVEYPGALKTNEPHLRFLFYSTKVRKRKRGWLVKLLSSLPSWSHIHSRSIHVNYPRAYIYTRRSVASPNGYICKSKFHYAWIDPSSCLNTTSA